MPILNLLIISLTFPTSDEIKYRPDFWWNNYDGLKAGININGNYMRHHHLFDISAWLNTAY